MADYRIWGRVEPMPGSNFFVIASAVPERASEATTVRTLLAHSLEQAQAVKERLMIELGQMLAGRGDRVVDVEET